MWLFPLLLIVPMIEIALFIIVGDWLTLWPTLGLVILTGILGAVLMRWQGLKVVNELRSDLDALQNPLSPLAHGALILLAGMLLIIPGFFTDAIGLLLMIPKVRELIIRHAGSRIQVQRYGRASSPFETEQDQHRGRHAGPTVIDAEFYEVDENVPPRGPSGWTRH